MPIKKNLFLREEKSDLEGKNIRKKCQKMNVIDFDVMIFILFKKVLWEKDGICIDQFSWHYRNWYSKFAQF